MSDIKASDWQSDENKQVPAKSTSTTKITKATVTDIHQYKKKKKAKTYNEVSTALLIIGLVILLMFILKPVVRNESEDADASLTRIYNEYNKQQEEMEKRQNADPITKFFMDLF